MAVNLRFKGKKRQNGNSEVVTIPKAIARLLQDGTKYEFLIEGVSA